MVFQGDYASDEAMRNAMVWDDMFFAYRDKLYDTFGKLVVNKWISEWWSTWGIVVRDLGKRAEMAQERRKARGEG